MYLQQQQQQQKKNAADSKRCQMNDDNVETEKGSIECTHLSIGWFTMVKSLNHSVNRHRI